MSAELQSSSDRLSLAAGPTVGTWRGPSIGFRWGWSRALTRGNASSEDLGPLGKGVISLSIVGIHRISSHARAAVEWTVEELARRTGLTAKTIHHNEHGENATIETLERIKAVFEAEGVTWIPENGGPATVCPPRGKPPAPATSR